MARKRRYTELITVYLTEDQYKHFKRVCDQRDIKMTAAIRQVIDDLIEKYLGLKLE